jgi:anti-anti-sigma factor
MPAQRGITAQPRPSTRRAVRSPLLRITIQRPHIGLPVVRMTGEIDLSSRERIEELIRQRMTAASLQAIVLDLTGITFCSSCGVEMLLQAQYRAEQRRVPLHVVPSPPVQRMLDLTDSAPFFALHSTTAQAMAAAARGPR